VIASFVRALLSALVLMAVLARPAAAEAAAAEDAAKATADCYGADNGRRISGCSELLQGAPLPDADRSMVHALRALAYSVQGQYDLALLDYDAAIGIDPDFAIALNNRAWTHYKLGQNREGMADVERALELTPRSSHAYDTRAHLRRVMGRPAGALADYERAISYGGAHVIELYQCGMQAQGFFNGEIDGLYSPAFRRALESCVESPECDPLPPDEECRKLTS